MLATTATTTTDPYVMFYLRSSFQALFTFPSSQCYHDNAGYIIILHCPVFAVSGLSARFGDHLAPPLFLFFFSFLLSRLV